VNWLEMLRGPPGRLDAVRRLTDEEIAARAADLEARGDVVCAGCGWQGFARGAIYRGVFEHNKASGRFDVPARSGLCVYECPACHQVGDRVDHADSAPQGMMFVAGWHVLKGEWRLHQCASDSCAGRGTPFVSLGCPGCGSFRFWHHASNAPPNVHGWSVAVDGGNLLTMGPSLHEPDTGCHFFIEGGRVRWV